MKYGPSSILILASAIGALASPTQNVLSVSKPRPLVIWHGLGAPALFPGILVRVMMSPSLTGDSYDSSGLLEFQSAIKGMHRGIFIHSVYVDPDSKKDRHATLVRSEYPQSSSSMTFVGLHSLSYAPVRERRRAGGTRSSSTEKFTLTIGWFRCDRVLPRFVLYRRQNKWYSLPMTMNAITRGAVPSRVH